MLGHPFKLLNKHPLPLDAWRMMGKGKISYTTQDKHRQNELLLNNIFPTFNHFNYVKGFRQVHCVHTLGLPFPLTHNAHAHTSTHLCFKHCQFKKERPPPQLREDKVGAFVRIFLVFSAETNTPKSTLLAERAKIKILREGLGIKDFWVAIFISTFFLVLR